MEIEIIRKIANEAFVNLESELDTSINIDVTDSTNILEILDSMDVVSLIIETESLLEEKFNCYIPLASDASFDAELSPLLSFGDWLSYIHQEVSLKNASK